MIVVDELGMYAAALADMMIARVNCAFDVLCNVAAGFCLRARHD
jgi:hypothetical protein